MSIKHLHTGDEVKRHLQIGMWCSNCCREEIEQIKTQQDINKWTEYLALDEPFDVLTIADTYEEIWRVME